MQTEDVSIRALIEGIRNDMLPPQSGWWSKAYVTGRDIRNDGQERRYEIIRRGRILFRELEGAGTAKIGFISVAV